MVWVWGFRYIQVSLKEVRFALFPQKWTEKYEEPLEVEVLWDLLKKQVCGHGSRGGVQVGWSTGKISVIDSQPLPPSAPNMQSDNIF